MKKSATTKIYTVKICHTKKPDKVLVYSLPELIGYFSYTLEIGHSWNPKISKQPKTIKSFITNLNKSYHEKEASCYERTSVELIS